MSLNSSPNPEIQKAVQRLSEGKVVGMPTETVYGLAARIDLESGIEAIFKTKERPFFDPLIVHIHSLDQMDHLVSEFPEAARVLAKKFWPGPLTMVLPKHADVNTMITSGLETVGVRMPQHHVALELLRAVKVPLAAPSANKFGKTSPTSAQHVREEFAAENVFVLEGGESTIGIESTVLSVKVIDGETRLAILRPGHVLKSELTSALEAAGISFQFMNQINRKESPGQMKHHYMPSVPLILCEGRGFSTDELRKKIEEKIALLPDVIEDVKIIKPIGGIKNLVEVQLSSDPVMAARSFYSELRRLSSLGGDQRADCLLLFRDDFHQGERWQSLYDRIEKAASLVLKGE